MKSRDQEKYQNPTFGNARGSDYDLFESNNSDIQEAKRSLISMLEESFNSNIFVSESFYTIFRSGGGLKSHNHIAGIDKDPTLNLASKKYVSVYYLSIGDQNCKNPGILKLNDPDLEILPKEGMLIVFPANRLHSVFYEGTKERIIIGVNFYTINEKS
jgi:hypothetical protein